MDCEQPWNATVTWGKGSDKKDLDIVRRVGKYLLAIRVGEFKGSDVEKRRNSPISVREKKIMQNNTITGCGRKAESRNRIYRPAPPHSITPCRIQSPPGRIVINIYCGSTNNIKPAGLAQQQGSCHRLAAPRPPDHTFTAPSPWARCALALSPTQHKI